MVPLRVASLLLLSLSADGFSIRPSTGPKISASPIKIQKSYVQRPPRQAVAPLQASSSGIIPYYEELMERMPSKRVLEVVDKARGSPIVASGEFHH